MTSGELYDEIIKRGIPHSNHYSDLYIPATSETRELLKDYEFRGNVTSFTNRVEGGVWFDIPFSFTPYWDKRQQRSMR